MRHYLKIHLIRVYHWWRPVISDQIKIDVFTFAGANTDQIPLKIGLQFSQLEFGQSGPIILEEFELYAFNLLICCFNCQSNIIIPFQPSYI
jgi:hypothetical protein